MGIVLHAGPRLQNGDLEPTSTCAVGQRIELSGSPGASGVAGACAGVDEATGASAATWACGGGPHIQPHSMWSQ